MNADPLATHEVFNQTPPFGDANLAALDTALTGAVAAFGDASDAQALLAYGARVGAAAHLELGRIANENPPKLRDFDARGRRQDLVEFHPAYHELMRASVEAGLASSTYEGAPALRVSASGKAQGKGHVLRSAM